MITGKELKQMIATIPDNAAVMIDGNSKVDIVGVMVEFSDDIVANLEITDGFSITLDSIMGNLFNDLTNLIGKC